MGKESTKQKRGMSTPTLGKARFNPKVLSHLISSFFSDSDPLNVHLATPAFCTLYYMMGPFCPRHIPTLLLQPQK